jgi:hypothetical protein
MQLIFFVPPNEELEGTLHPKNLDVPPKMKVKGYMYPQMKKPVGMLSRSRLDGIRTHNAIVVLDTHYI